RSPLAGEGVPTLRKLLSRSPTRSRSFASASLKGRPPKAAYALPARGRGVEAANRATASEDDYAILRDDCGCAGRTVFDGSERADRIRPARAQGQGRVRELAG